MKESLKPNTSMGPVPVVMISCSDGDKTNITTIAWTGIASSEPPMVYVSLRKSRYSYDIIKKTGEFILNIPDKNMAWETDYCGTKSGKNVNKFEEAHLTEESAKIVKCPMIKECPINLECKIKKIEELGSHDMFIAEVVKVHCEEKYLKIGSEGNKTIDYTKVEALLYAGTKYMVADKIIADRGICLK